MEFLTDLLDNSTMPWLTALLLGLMTAISPCPLATNISAVGFISRDIENRNRVFINGLLYTLGRAITYTAVALIILLGADQLKFSGFFQRYGEKIIGPLLIIIGLFMLDIIKINFPGFTSLTSKMQDKKKWGYLDAVLLGVVFALAFCPYSGVLYFGMLVPLTIASSASGLYLPVVYAIATGIPVIVFAWIIAYTVSGIGGAYNKIKIFELWFRRIISVLFIIVGIYYIIRVYF
ncbi:MAG: cytochrome C biogenesis protein [Bacteroidetes bacterium GWE2_41_25]|nr:MAG: cytochrome C biogenesis protein [Bacteroidetes bacterium GWA2_40_15]OFX94501.1 MAG: cytochrome C biogenesis protein [Bacteroidetes bacterium GWC2_40_22]OFY11109.1 MAG: cytochrome C biogenesis protein [Bacteroidetes bacterium GWE2_41_25]OFY58808.1 MAG: cytochrome C biogenesis protein [Bacteroidetes bacterium GWF2_41_9]HBH83964.1 cytochrome C biogenesis protein [Bacteroidales bacterium]